MLTEQQIEDAAKLLVSARISNSVIESIPVNIRPTSLKEAYAIQDCFIKQLGADTCGWFGACTNDVIQNLLGLNEPYYAYLLSDHLYQSPATIDTTKYPPIVFECEFGFVTDRDFLPEGYPYNRETIEDAIVRVCPAIEIVAGHLENWPNQDVFSVIADTSAKSGDFNW